MGLRVGTAGGGRRFSSSTGSIPERNEFLAINQFRVDEPGGQAHKFVVPDVVLFVNGIPLVVIECKSPYITSPLLRRSTSCSGMRISGRASMTPRATSGCSTPNQFVVATYFDQALVGTFTSEGEHFAEWKETEPVSREDVAAELGEGFRRAVEPGDAGRWDAATGASVGHRAELHAVHADRGSHGQDRRPVSAVPGGAAIDRTADDGQDAASRTESSIVGAGSSGTPRARGRASRWCS